jgi:hypothetical protein
LPKTQKKGLEVLRHDVGRYGENSTVGALPYFMATFALTNDVAAVFFEELG